MDKIRAKSFFDCGGEISILLDFYRHLLLSNDDDDGYENVTRKVNSRCLKLYRACSISFNSSNVDKFFWS